MPYSRFLKQINRLRPPARRQWSRKIGRREWDRTTDHYHVKVVLYH